VAKPSPGVNDTSALVGVLTFRALQVTAPASSAITLSYVSGSYDDSDVIMDDGNGTDILAQVINNADITVYADYAVACTGYTYAEWSDCQNGVRTRTILTKIPEGCVGGVPPETTKACDGQTDCTSFDYNEWGNCQSNNTQTRTVKASYPAGCVGGAPLLVQSCQYEEEEEEKKDKEDPKFTDLPRFLVKQRGGIIWWKATDNKKIDHYAYNFNGKKISTHRKHFVIPINTPRGVYMIWVRAYDKAGNAARRFVTVVVK
jgi:hypothetical protein